MGNRDSRRERKKQETRQRLLECAWRLFREKGIDQATVEDITEAADVGYDVINVLFAGLLGIENDFLLREAGFGGTAEVKDYFQQLADAPLLDQRLADVRWQNIKQGVQVIGNYFLQDSLPGSFMGFRQRYPESIYVA